MGKKNLAAVTLFVSFLGLTAFFQSYSYDLGDYFDFDKAVEQLDKHVSCLSVVQYGDITLQDINFKDKRIADCAHQIEVGDNLKPLKKLWADVKFEGGINKVFVSEFCVLLFFSYQSVLRNVGALPAKPTTRVSWFAIMALYAQLSAIPLPKLFDALEECWILYQNISNEYKVEGEPSFGAWLQEYWWVPSTCIAFVAVSFARWFKDRQARVANQKQLAT
jgi:hypothetical protein